MDNSDHDVSSSTGLDTEAGAKVEEDSKKGVECGAKVVTNTVRAEHSAEKWVEDIIPTKPKELTTSCTKKHFVSKDLCVRIVNSNNKNTIVSWLKDCGVKIPKKKKKVAKYRESLLKHTQSIADGKVVPKIFFLTSFFKEVPYWQLDEEAKRLGVNIPAGTFESQARRIINEYLAYGKLSPALLTDEGNSCVHNSEENTAASVTNEEKPAGTNISDTKSTPSVNKTPGEMETAGTDAHRKPPKTKKTNASLQVHIVHAL